MAQSDTALFDKWRSSKDADAFAELLSRHATMVYGACLRVVKNPSLAEDIAQESFLELMKGPEKVRSVGGWLHTVATRRALDRLKSEGRRVEREANYAAIADTVVEATWDDTREFVDEAIAALPEELRVPIILRFLEAWPQKDIARELGLSRSAVRLRIEKGIGLVRDSLSKRGVLCTVAGLSTLLENVPAEAAPPELLSELGKQALAQAPAPALLAGFTIAKYALIGTAVAAMGAFTYSTLNSAGEAPASETLVASAEEGAVAAVPPEKPAPLAAPALAAGAPQKVGEVVETVAEVAPATVAAEEAKTGWTLDLTPSEETRQALKHEANIEFENIHIKDVLEFLQDSFAINMVLDFREVAPEEPSIIPADSHFPQDYISDGHIRGIKVQKKSLEEALTLIVTPLNLTYKVIGTVVWVSSSRQITQDMTVQLPATSFSEADILTSLDAPVNIEFEDIHLSDVLEFLQDSFDIKIVEDTRVIVPEVQRGAKPPPWSTMYTTSGMIPYINLKNASLGEALYNLTRLLDLTYRVDRDGVYISTPDLVKQVNETVLASYRPDVDPNYDAIQPSVSGTITLPDGAPFVDAQVAVHDVALAAHWNRQILVTTDETGYYAVYGLEPATYGVKLAEPGMHSWSDHNEVGRFTLTGGEVKEGLDIVFGTEGYLTVSGTVVDSAGQPIAGARITKNGPVPRGDVTDESGRFTLRFLPPGQVTLFPEARGYTAPEETVNSGDEEIRIEMLKPGGIAGRVVDVETGKAITTFEAAYLDFHADQIQDDMFSRVSRFAGEEGTFKFNRMPVGDVTVVARATGYESAMVTTSVKEDTVRDDITVRLKRIGPQPLVGTVISVEGDPVVGAKVFLGRMEPLAMRDQKVAAVTDARGAFAIENFPGDLPFITAWHPDFAPGNATLAETDTIVLEKAGRLNVEVYSEGAPVTPAEVHVFYPVDRRLDFVSTTPIDAEGSAVVEEVLPGAVTIEVVLPNGRRPYTQVNLAPGEEKRVRIDVAPPAATVEGVVVQDGQPVSERVVTLFIETASGTERIRKSVSPDGTFSIQELPLGQAKLVACKEDQSQRVLIRDVPLRAGKVSGLTADMTITHRVNGRVTGIPAGSRARVVMLHGAMGREEAIAADFSATAGFGDAGEGGVFELAAHRAGTYTLLVLTHPENDPGNDTYYESRVVELSDGEALHVDFKLNK